MAGESVPQNLLDNAQVIYTDSKAVPAAQQSLPLEAGYRLGTGDELKITVFGEDDLSGTYRIGPDGTLTMPLIGTLAAQGQTVLSLQKAIAAALADGYLRNPNVSIELSGLRPYFIMGEVRQPGSYPYMGGMTALNAVAVAGGFTYRASEDKVKLLRPAENPDAYMRVPVGEKIYPGDIIVVEERFF